MPDPVLPVPEDKTPKTWNALLLKAAYTALVLGACYGAYKLGIDCIPCLLQLLP